MQIAGSFLLCADYSNYATSSDLENYVSKDNAFTQQTIDNVIEDIIENTDLIDSSNVGNDTAYDILSTIYRNQSEPFKATFNNANILRYHYLNPAKFNDTITFDEFTLTNSSREIELHIPIQISCTFTFDSRFILDDDIVDHFVFEDQHRFENANRNIVDYVVYKVTALNAYGTTKYLIRYANTYHEYKYVIDNPVLNGYFCITSLEDNNKVFLNQYKTKNYSYQKDAQMTVEYTKNPNAYTFDYTLHNSYDASKNNENVRPDDFYYIILSAGQSVWLKGTNRQTVYYNKTLNYYIYNQLASTKKFNVHGNISSMFSPEYSATEGYSKSNFLNYFLSKSNVVDLTLSGISFIPNHLCNNCKSLSSVYISDEVTEDEGNSFVHCENLVDVRLSENLSNLGGYTFSNCRNLTHIHIPDTVTDIDYTFASCTALSSIHIPSSLTSIYRGFEECYALSSVVFPSCMVRISQPFHQCSALQSITIESSGAIITAPFYLDSQSLKEVVFTNGSDKYHFDSTSSVLFDIDDTRCLGVTNKYYSFDDGVFNADSLEGIAVSSVSSFDTQGFSYCHNLNRLDFSDFTSLKILNGSVFTHCDNLSSIVFPDNLLQIKQSAFSFNRSLVGKNICLSNCTSLSAIDEGAFRNQYIHYKKNISLNGIIRGTDNNTKTGGSNSTDSCAYGIFDMTNCNNLTSLGFIFRNGEYSSFAKGFILPSSLNTVSKEVLTGPASSIMLEYPSCYTSMSQCYSKDISGVFGCLGCYTDQELTDKIVGNDNYGVIPSGSAKIIGTEFLNNEFNTMMSSEISSIVFEWPGITMVTPTGYMLQIAISADQIDDTAWKSFYVNSTENNLVNDYPCLLSSLPKNNDLQNDSYSNVLENDYLWKVNASFYPRGSTMSDIYHLSIMSGECSASYANNILTFEEWALCDLAENYSIEFYYTPIGIDDVVTGDFYTHVLSASGNDSSNKQPITRYPQSLSMLSYGGSSQNIPNSRNLEDYTAQQGLPVGRILHWRANARVSNDFFIYGKYNELVIPYESSSNNYDSIKIYLEQLTTYSRSVLQSITIAISDEELKQTLLDYMRQNKEIYLKFKTILISNISSTSYRYTKDDSANYARGIEGFKNNEYSSQCIENLLNYNFIRFKCSLANLRGIKVDSYFKLSTNVSFDDENDIFLSNYLPANNIVYDNDHSYDGYILCDLQLLNEKF